MYLDDVVLFRDDSDKLWEWAIRVICESTAAGFLLNIKKRIFIFTDIKMLGFFIVRKEIKLY